MKRLTLALIILAFGLSGCYDEQTEAPPSPPPAPVATQAEMEAGTEDGKRTVSPLLVAQAISAQAAAGVTGIVDADVAAAGNTDTTHSYSKDDIHDYVIQFDTDLDGALSDETWLGTAVEALDLSPTGTWDLTGLTSLTTGPHHFADGAVIYAQDDNSNTMTSSAAGWTFNLFPMTPSAAPDADYEVANKKYVDDTAVGGGTDWTTDQGATNIHINNLDWATVWALTAFEDEAQDFFDSNVSNSAWDGTWATDTGSVASLAVLDSILINYDADRNGVIDGISSLVDVEITGGDDIDASTMAVWDGSKLLGSGISTDSVVDDAIEFVIDGGGAEIATGVHGFLEIPFDCTVVSVTLLADQSGSVVVDLWMDTYANYPPTDADTITSSTPPTITTATKSQDTTLTSWTTSLVEGSILGFNVDSVTTCERVTVSIKVQKI